MDKLKGMATEDDFTKNFPVKTTTPYRVPKYEEIPNKYDPFMVSICNW